MPKADRWRYWLCALGGGIAALCFAAPLEEITRSLGSDGNYTVYSIADRVYFRSTPYSVDREKPFFERLAFDPLEQAVPSMPCRGKLLGPMSPAKGNPQTFLIESIIRTGSDRVRYAFERPAIEALMKRIPIALQLLDGCLRASLLKPLCGRYVMSVAAAARDGKRDAIAREQADIRRTVSAAFCIAGGSDPTVSAPRPGR